MKIVAGHYRSRIIKTLPNDHTRPTSDKVRSAIFSRVGPFFQEGLFLDCFGGSGAMGIEALSRGMEKTHVIENHRDAMNLIKQNYKDLGLLEQCECHFGDIMKIFPQLNETFDLIFMDPPYNYPYFNELIESIVEHRLLKEDAVLIVESDKHCVLKEAYGDLVCVKDKTYGHTRVRYYEVV